MDKEVSAGVRANQSAEKLLRIMEYLSMQNEPVRLIDISKALKINESTALRFLTTLIDNGYTEQDKETSRYYMTYKLCALTARITENIDLRTVIRPYMREISEMFGETVCLAIEKDMKVVYIDVLESQNSMIRSMNRIGHIAPMHCTGIGKLLLLNYSEEDIDKLIARKGLTRFTEHTAGSKWDLMQLLNTVRRDGVAYDNEECEIGARCVAVPVYDASGKVIAGISITGLASRLTDAVIEPRLESLKKIAATVSAKMGYMSLK